MIFESNFSIFESNFSIFESNFSTFKSNFSIFESNFSTLSWLPFDPEFVPESTCGCQRMRRQVDKSCSEPQFLASIFRSLDSYCLFLTSECFCWAMNGMDPLILNDENYKMRGKEKEKKTRRDGEEEEEDDDPSFSSLLCHPSPKEGKQFWWWRWRNYDWKWLIHFFGLDSLPSGVFRLQKFGKKFGKKLRRNCTWIN